MMSKQEERFQEVYTAQKGAVRVKKGDSLAYQEASARGDMYRFLSAVFLSPPKKDFLEQIVDKDFLEELSMLFDKNVVAGLKKFAAVSNLNKDLASLKQEYMDLFAVPTGRYVTPFEDVYRGIAVDGQQERGPLLGEQAIAVTKIYREAGGEMDRACKELPTHIGVELSFMSFLCEKEALAVRNEEGEALLREKTKATDSTRYRELQMRFLREHLNKWFPQLSQTIQANAKSEIYSSFALITEEFLTQETTRLKELQ